jgi:hypothetical protein
MYAREVVSHDAYDVDVVRRLMEGDEISSTVRRILELNFASTAHAAARRRVENEIRNGRSKLSADWARRPRRRVWAACPAANALSLAQVAV